MKTEITAKDYIDYYEACSWDPIMFEKLLRHFGYDFGNLIVSHALDLEKTKIAHLVGIKMTTMSLDLDDTLIESLGDLREVNGNLFLSNTKINNLGKLRRVSHSLWLPNTPIESLENLQKVGGNLKLYDTPISQKYSEEEIRKMVDVGGDIYM